MKEKIKKMMASGVFGDGSRRAAFDAVRANRRTEAEAKAGYEWIDGRWQAVDDGPALAALDTSTTALRVARKIAGY